MSPAVAAQLEQKLDSKGTVSLTQSEIEGYFHFRAKKLLRKSGKDALKLIRSGKCGHSPAWTELTSLATLIR